MNAMQTPSRQAQKPDASATMGRVRRGGGKPRAFAVTRAERAWLRLGLDQPGGKLPLFDPAGQAIDADLIRSCVAKGAAEPWFINPLKPDWLVCRLTEAGRAQVR